MSTYTLLKIARLEGVQGPCFEKLSVNAVCACQLSVIFEGFLVEGLPLWAIRI